MRVIARQRTEALPVRIHHEPRGPWCFGGLRLWAVEFEHALGPRVLRAGFYELHSETLRDPLPVLVIDDQRGARRRAWIVEATSERPDRAAQGGARASFVNALRGR